MNQPATDQAVTSSELWLRTPDDILARIPFALGFHPSNSLVVFTVDAAGRSDLTVRTILSGAGGPPADDPTVPYDDWLGFSYGLAASMVHRDVHHAVVVAYTSSLDEARRSAETLGAALDASGIGVLDVLWVDGTRWRSLSCVDERCCPLEGRIYDPTAPSRVAAESVFHGEVALDDEDEVRRSIAPIRGPARLAMYHATARMDAEASRRYLRDSDDSDDSDDGGGGGGGGGGSGASPKIADSVRSDGKAYVMALIDRCLTDDHRPTDDEVAWAAMYLYDVEVRDMAWLRMTQETAQRHVQLWRELGCRAIPPYHVAPLTLLAFAAWLSGNGVLARYTVDRVLKADPDYSMAHLVRDILVAMVPPSVWPPELGQAEDSEEVDGSEDTDEAAEPAEPDCAD